MSPCAIEMSAESSVTDSTVAGALLGGGDGLSQGGNGDATACELLVVGAGGLRPRVVPATHVSEQVVSAGAPGRYPGPQFHISAALVATPEAYAMTLVELFATAILTLWPSMQLDTATRYATDVENAVDADLELGMALVVTMHAEATARPEDIEHCNYKPWEGDRDGRGTPRALGLYQLHYYWWDGHTREEICASNTLASILAAKEMRNHVAVTRGNWHRALRRHVGFNIDPKDPRVVNRPKNFDRVLANARRTLALN